MIERPTNPTQEMKLEAAKEIIASLMSGGHLDDDGDGQAAEDLAKMRWQDDGYEIAKDLDDNHCWDCSMGMLDDLDNFGWSVRKRVEEAQKKWAEVNDIKPPYPLGTHVTWRRHAGVITGIYEYGAAQYLIAEDSDTEAHTERSRRIIVNFEDVTPTEKTSVKGASDAS